MRKTLSIGFIYHYCRDIKETKHFYTDFLGLEEINYNNEEKSPWKWVVYQSNKTQIMFFQVENQNHILPPESVGFSNLPGDGIGDHLESSFSIVGHDFDSFKETFIRIKNGHYEVQNNIPTWRQNSYWGLTVKDPSGRTIEICWQPDEGEHHINIDWNKIAEEKKSLSL